MEQEFTKTIDFTEDNVKNNWKRLMTNMCKYEGEKDTMMMTMMTMMTAVRERDSIDWSSIYK